MFKLGGFIIDFVIGMLVSAYLLSHTAIGQKLYATIAPMPTITSQDINNIMKAAENAGSRAVEIGGKLYEIVK